MSTVPPNIFAGQCAMNKDSLTNQRQSTIIACVTLGSIAAGSAFYFFGLAIAFIFVPMAVAAFWAYRLHLSRLEQKTAQILKASRVHLETVEALATAIDARDQLGAGHVRRTQIYAVRLGEKAGLTKDQIDALRTGALLHDIGKLAVPDHILRKPGTLTPAEIEKTKRHSSVGAAILENIDFPSPVVPTIKHHHENWDGTGYPLGLSAENIPVTARILAIANAYDSLRCDRPYRKAKSRDFARRHMQAQSARQFDPSLVQIFLKNLAWFEAEIDALGLSYADSVSTQEINDGDPATGFIEQIKLANREAFTLYELAREFGSSVRINETMSLFTSKIREFVPFNTCAVFLMDENAGFANVIHAEGDHTGLFMSKSIRVGTGATGIALKKREIVKNVNPDLDFSLSALEVVQEYKTMVSLPLIHDGELIGAVSVYSRELEFYADEHIRILETISRIAADAIGKSKQHDEAQAHAMTDPMTGLPNARSLQLQFEREVARADRGDSSFQVLMLDLDGFKQVNDSFGHMVGDKMLDEVGQVILGQLREYDFLARYGGDEFVALIPNASSTDVLELCKRVEKAVSEFKLAVDVDTTASVGVSLGAAEYPGNGGTFDQIIAVADRVMYNRKTRRKQAKAAEKLNESVQISESVTTNNNVRVSVDRSYQNMPSSEGFIVELDESHVISSNAIN